MNNNPNLKTFENTSLVTYLNKVLPRYERSVLLSDKSNVEKLIREVDTDIFKAFLLNSDLLLDVLYTYESVQMKLNLLENIKEDLKRLRLKFGKADAKLVDKKRLEEFRNVLQNFSTEVGSYDTGERVLMYYDVLLDKNESKNILLLTNDVLIIGKIDSQVRKYQLVNAFSYSIMDIKVNEEDLYVVLSNSSLQFKGNKENVQRLLRTFKDLTYSFTDQVEPVQAKERQRREGVLDFLMETEQYGQLDKYNKRFMRDNELEGASVYKKEDLLGILKVVEGRDVSNFLSTFLIDKFKLVIFNLDKVLPLEDLIDKVFETLKEFNEEQQILIKEIRKEHDLDQSSILLMLEKQVLMCLTALEKRIFNRKLQTNDIRTILNKVKGKLVFNGFDFCYLVDFYESRRAKHKERCLEDAKREIEALLLEMVG